MVGVPLVKTVSAALAAGPALVYARPRLATPAWAGMVLVREANSATLASCAMKSRKRPTSLGDLVVFSATQAAPPGMPEQAAGPQGLGTATQSKALPISFCMRLICHEPERII